MKNYTLPPRDETFELSPECKTVMARKVLPHEIKGVDTYLINVGKGQRVDLSIGKDRQVICFLVEGEGTVTNTTGSHPVSTLTLFHDKPGETLCFAATANSVILKIEMDLRPGEYPLLKETSYPLVLKYNDCEKYRDYFKSEKTVSRTLVAPFTLPRFAMGSVETTGPDRIQPHAHPVLDQLFFSFKENNCTLLIDEESYPYKGNNLLHVPLGCDHGIDAKEGEIVHYLWIDFFEHEKDQQFLVDVHKPV